MVSFSSVPCFCLHASCKAASFGDVHSSDPRACFFELLLFFIGRSPFCTSSALFTGSVPQKYNPAGDRPSHLISVILAEYSFQVRVDSRWRIALLRASAFFFGQTLPSDLLNSS